MKKYPRVGESVLLHHRSASGNGKLTVEPRPSETTITRVYGPGSVKTASGDIWNVKFSHVSQQANKGYVWKTLN